MGKPRLHFNECCGVYTATIPLFRQDSYRIESDGNRYGLTVHQVGKTLQLGAYDDVKTAKQVATKHYAIQQSAKTVAEAQTNFNAYLSNNFLEVT